MKENFIEFYVNKFSYLKTLEDVEISFIPPILRRRMSKFDKGILTVLNRVLSDDIENIVFSSQYGEVERLLKLIGQYSKDNEVSPNVFSGSVHNFSLGFYLLNVQKTIPYNALSACEKSLSTGFLSSVIANYDNNLFCYGDISEDNFVSMAINLSKTCKKDSSKYILRPSINENLSDNFEYYIELFTGNKKSIKTPLFTIEKEADND